MKVTSKDASRLIAIMIVSKILFSDINIFVQNSGTAAYMEAIVCALCAIAIFLAEAHFYKKIGCIGFFDSIEEAFGKVLKSVIGAFLLVYGIVYTAIVLKLYSDAIITIAYPNSRSFYVMAFIVVTMLITAYNGIDTVTKFCSVCLVSMITLIAILYALSLKEADVSNLFPIFGCGSKSIIFGAKNIFMYNEVFFLFLLSEYLEKSEDAPRVGLRAVATSSAVIIISVLVYTLCVPYPASKMFNIPLLQLASSTEMDIFFQRTEGIFFLLWIYSSFLYLGASFYFTLHIFKKTCNSTDFKALIPSLAVIIILVTNLFENNFSVMRCYRILSAAFAVFAFAVPLLSFVVCYVKRRGEGV